MRNPILAATSIAAPVVLATGAMLVVFVVIQQLPPGSARDGLTGAIVGGLVTLLTTLAAQEMKTRAEARTRREQDATRERSLMAAFVSELTYASTYLTRITTPATLGTWQLLPTSAWTLHHVELGEHWHPDDLTALSVAYHDVDNLNALMRKLGAPADGSFAVAEKEHRVDPDLLKYLVERRERLDTVVLGLMGRMDEQARQFGWAIRPARGVKPAGN